MTPQVGRMVVAATLQVLRPAGNWVDIPGRPRDIVLSPDGRFLYVKNLSQRNRLSLAVFDVERQANLQTLEDRTDSRSFHGIALTRDGGHLYTTTDEGWVRELLVANLKGWGSLHRPAVQKGFHIRNLLGTITLVDLPDEATLAAYTQRVR
ncbi:MAG: lactonase family protein [Acidobacteria bacterium]|nr:lactonase family protein [Acidobacteriota bacterium]